ncbi:DUF6266 family protein [Pedobacter heparinus]|uniref:DUF6266 family protein n=1 Tax=Pedobacter heparinus TaxID=984 RepID=UPI002930ADC3|nr:DUF6266 family protein [Pedobacter heparinus]
MRLTTVILIASLVQVSAATFAQRITLSERKASLENILKEIRKQSGYDFYYDRKVVVANRQIAINVKDATLEQTLSKVFAGLPLEYTIDEKIVVIKEKMPSFLDRIVSAFNTVDTRGKIVGENGAPIAGANVSVKGTSKSAITDQNGSFYIAGVDERSILVISYVGYVTKEVAAGATSLGNITLIIGSSDLQEVTINKGYYNTTQRLNTGNVSSVKSDVISRQPVSDILTALEGRVPGLYISQNSGIPGGSFVIKLRGQNSIGNGNNPLYVIDNIPYNTTNVLQSGIAGANGAINIFSSIRPNDIESIEVLKDDKSRRINKQIIIKQIIMATYKNGINGAISGKVGNVVGATCRGIAYLRSLPETIKAPTEKQINQRLKFAVVMGWLQPLLKIINIGYQILSGYKTSMNRAVSYHLTEAVVGDAPDYQIDFKKAIFSRGELLVSWILELLCLVNAVLSIKWDNGPASAFCNDDDQASFVIYNPEKEAFVTFTDVATRQQKEAVLQLPEDFAGDTVHCWQHFVNAAGDAVSTSVYLGEVMVG